jgi:hypothetical protein
LRIQKFKGYGENCWGLTAGDSYKGYVAHCPSEDFGVIQPTVALSSLSLYPGIFHAGFETFLL